ncbi:MAG: hypothetical protein JNN28_21645 [Saprospiraceae bacterium]|nr:hypothetical protein [Saprospiraceae bacterium]
MFQNRFFIPFLLACLGLASCTRNTTLRVLQPAQMTLPEHISTVAMIDRSKPSNGWSNFFEGLLTGEQIGQDRRSRQTAMDGLTNALTRTPRFQVKSTGIELTGSKAGGRMPAALDWSEIDRICRDYGANAVVSIESFDSDNSRRSWPVNETKKDKTGKKYTVTTFRSEQRTGVRIGWRLYDPKTKIILDEYVTDDYLERTGSGTTDRAALNNLPNQLDVTRDVAYNVGIEYGARIAPIYVNVTRAYYHKAKGYKSYMKEAARHLVDRDMEKAAILWKKVIALAGTSNKKAAGRAAYNMAVAAEINGNLDLALEWATKSYQEYGNKKAREYINVIKQRQNDARKADAQLPGKKA